jgi:hypothetical protein
MYFFRIWQSSFFFSEMGNPLPLHGVYFIIECPKTVVHNILQLMGRISCDMDQPAKEYKAASYYFHCTISITLLFAIQRCILLKLFV